MNKKLRLLVTANCHNHCPLCCNKQFKFDDIPVVDRLDYEERLALKVQTISLLTESTGNLQVKR